MDGEGAEHPDILFVGEAPGGEEDEEGYPFCGKAGKIMRESIEDIGIDIQKCRFTNVVRCRPPDNDLKKFPKAIDHCRPHILREIRSCRPKIVVLVGNSALQSILNKRGILKLHNEVIDAGWVKYVCMFHPAYLLRNDLPSTHRQFKEALKTVKFLATGKMAEQKSKRKHTIILDKKMAYEFRDMLVKQEYLATDIEASTLSPFARKKQPMVGVVGFAWSSHDACAFPVRVREGLKNCSLSLDLSLEIIKDIYEQKSVKFLTWHGKYDFGYPMVLYDIWMGGKLAKLTSYFDGMLGSYALDERGGFHGLKDWALQVGMGGYDLKVKQYQRDHKETNPEYGGDMLLIPADILYPYNMDDCICTWRACFKQFKLLKRENLFKMPTMFPIRQVSWMAGFMEINGIQVDQKQNEKLQKDFSVKIEKYDSRLRRYDEVKQLQEEQDMEQMREIYKRVKAYKRPVANVKEKVLELFKKEPVNLNSPENKRRLIFGIIGCEHERMTRKSGEQSAERWVLEELLTKYKYPILRDMIERSMYSSYKSKYVDPIKDWIGSDGRVHSSVMPHGTKTGRLSSRDPNLFNLPARGDPEMVKAILTQFCARNENHYIVKQDSKQIELRLVADRSGDEAMIAEFNAYKDPHAMAAMAAYGYEEEEWRKLSEHKRKELRSNAKNAVSFGLVYGRHAKALAGDFGWSIERGEDFKEKYFTKYHGIREYLEKEEERILEQLYSTSSFHRRRRVPEAASEEFGTRGGAVREGINAPIQGDASDINILAAYRLERWLRRNEMKSRVILYVYDAVYVDTYYKEMEIVVPKLHEFMTDRKFLKEMAGWDLRVPLDTDCSIGPNAGQTEELKLDKDRNFIIPPKFLEKRVS